MTNFAHGRQAEDKAMEYLLENGYKIRDRNWRNRYCEIDIVAEKDKTVYFIEVKYRQSNFSGSGLDYITPKKLKQMEFAANFWVSENYWNGDISLGVIEVSGLNYQVTNFIDEVHST